MAVNLRLLVCRIALHVKFLGTCSPSIRRPQVKKHHQSVDFLLANDRWGFAQKLSQVLVFWPGVHVCASPQDLFGVSPIVLWVEYIFECEARARMLIEC